MDGVTTPSWFGSSGEILVDNFLTDFLSATYHSNIVRLPNDNQWSFDSQFWKGIFWKHKLLVTTPTNRVDGSLVLMVVTGDEADADAVWAQELANQSGLTVVTLFDIPNQPLWDLREDELIAHTFDQYFETGDPEWPLLMPMVRATKQAMDVVQTLLPKTTRFVLTGSSKRAWTCWLAACLGDERIAGIAPMVFDNLGFQSQLVHQKEIWGELSPMFEPYVAAEAVSRSQTPRGQDLLRLVDPLTQIQNLICPTLTVLGANDPYWAVDAHGLYWDEIPIPKYIQVIPNAGHGIGETLASVNTLSHFGKTVLGIEAMPSISFDLQEDSIQFDVQGNQPLSVTGWVADSSNNRFVESIWRQVEAETRICPGQAFFVEIDFGPYSLTSPAILNPIM